MDPLGMNPYFIQCPDYNPDNLREALSRLLRPLGGMEAFVRPGQKVLLKPNLLAAAAVEKRVTTDPALVEQVGRLALAAGGEVIIGDSPALDPFAKVGKRTGMAQAAFNLGVELVELDQPTPLEGSGRFKNLNLSRRALEADVIINLPKLKTHCQMALTLGVKNMFGAVVAQRKAEWHHMANDYITFAGMLLEVARAARPALTILDGIWGMEGNGPSNGRPRFFGLLAAAREALILDLNVAAMLGLDWDNYPLAQAAFAFDPLPDDWPPPLWLGEAPPAARLKNVEIPLALRSLRLLPGFMEGLTRRYVVSRPAQNPDRCILCGKCKRICPEQCISVRGNRLNFDYRRCIRCYCCQEVCPVNAISLRPGVLARLLQRLGR
jgi:uncharacterized protein (DUF362 family)/Pyruvate/2-oxoacid:ferredoxin oxidoreductase delta subunit